MGASRFSGQEGSMSEEWIRKRASDEEGHDVSAGGELAGPADAPQEMQHGWLDRQFANAAQDVSEMPDWLKSRAGPADAGSHKRTPEEIAKEIARGGLCEHLYSCNCLAEAIAQGIREGIANFAAADAGSHETRDSITAEFTKRFGGRYGQGRCASHASNNGRHCKTVTDDPAKWCDWCLSYSVWREVMAASASAPAAPRETPPTLEQRAERIARARNGWLDQEQFKALILSALQDVRAETMAEQNAGLLGSMVPGDTLRSSPTDPADELQALKDFLESALCQSCGGHGWREGQHVDDSPRVDCDDCDGTGHDSLRAFAEVQRIKAAMNRLGDELRMVSVRLSNATIGAGDIQRLLQAQAPTSDNGLQSQANQKEPTLDVRAEGQRETKTEGLPGTATRADSDAPPSTSAD